MSDASSRPTGPALDAPRCPLCGQANGCAAAATGHFEAACWCRVTRIDPEALAALPPQDRGRACLCPACASGRFPRPASPP